MSTYEDDEDYNPDYNEDEEYEMMYPDEDSSEFFKLLYLKVVNI